jgi:hypothetical protein
LVSDGISGAAYGYDLDGNPTNEEGRALHYDDSGHSIHLKMGYRPDGLRAWKCVPQAD